jgi:hypothetical protein
MKDKTRLLIEAISILERFGMFQGRRKDEDR